MTVPSISSGSTESSKSCSRAERGARHGRCRRSASGCRLAAGGPQHVQEAASGVPLAVIAFGFAVVSLSLANTEIINIATPLFVPVAFGTAYACFLFTTALILRWFAPEITALEGVGASGFGDAALAEGVGNRPKLPPNLLAQGRYFSGPLPAEETEAILARNEPLGDLTS